MRSWQELEEYGAVNGQVSTDSNRPESREDTDSGEIRTAGCNHTKNGCDANSEIERPSSTENVAAEAPEDGAEKQTDVLGECEELFK